MYKVHKHWWFDEFLLHCLTLLVFLMQEATHTPSQDTGLYHHSAEQGTRPLTMLEHLGNKYRLVYKMVTQKNDT